MTMMLNTAYLKGQVTKHFYSLWLKCANMCTSLSEEIHRTIIHPNEQRAQVFEFITEMIGITPTLPGMSCGSRRRHSPPHLCTLKKAYGKTIYLRTPTWCQLNSTEPTKRMGNDTCVSLILLIARRRLINAGLHGRKA